VQTENWLCFINGAKWSRCTCILHSILHISLICFGSEREKLDIPYKSVRTLFTRDYYKIDFLNFTTEYKTHGDFVDCLCYLSAGVCRSLLKNNTVRCVEFINESARESKCLSFLKNSKIICLKSVVYRKQTIDQFFMRPLLYV